jgi:hypothetical protein
MHSIRIQQRFLIVLALMTWSVAGCRSLPQSDYCSHIEQQPPCCANNVHAIFVESPFDVLNIGRLSSVADSLRQAGCANIETFSLYKHGNDSRLADRIRGLRSQNPNGRIVLVGYSTGALMVERALTVLEPEGIRVDSSVYLDANILNVFGAGNRPQNSDRTLLIYRRTATVPEDIPRSETYFVDVGNHLNVPCSQQCFDVLAHELLQQCSHGCPCACHHRTFEPIVQGTTESRDSTKPKGIDFVRIEQSTDLETVAGSAATLKRINVPAPVAPSK